ncbi:MAG: type I DNA topoisomerase [Armatimonadetes bacterium]|nr:type I DNA topoisomerase [Armatimonadota bacterium]
MSKTLVIVESPAKAKTISAFLDRSYEVVASYGHVRDLPENRKEMPDEFKKAKWADLGVNVEKDFEPFYVVPGDKRRRVDELKKAAKDAGRLLLATDEDREGESISWHVLQLLKPRKGTEVQRIVFHEITPEAIQEALENPRSVDEGLVRAQETRRILDRLYGYTLSPLLWRKVSPGLSAGRVQSVAVRLIVMRERERRDFVTVDYSGIEAKLRAADGSFVAKLARVADQSLADGQAFNPQGELVGRAYWMKADEATPLAERLATSEPWRVAKLDTKPGTENPPPPFMTSTLQQEANRKLGFPARKTMQIAQQLYEGVEVAGERVGLITYMRTDSLTLADRALSQAREVLRDLYGAEYVPAKPRVYKSQAKNAQEAHEAIRPTDLSRLPTQVERHLDRDQFRLYELIWKRTLACQTKAAEVERTRVEVEVAEGGRAFTFAASGKRIVFPGFLRVYVEGSDDPEAELGDKETILPGMKEGERLEAESVSATQHSTKPPARYTEASLVQKLEQEGVGRPSTYASIIGTIQDRGYVFKRKNELVPTWTAFSVTEILEDHFDRLVDIGFTAEMESELDEIAEGHRDWVQHLRTFYSGSNGTTGLADEVKEKGPSIPYPAMRLFDDVVVRIGRNGPFIQRGEGGAGNTASVPDDVPPADLTKEEVLALLERKTAAAEPVAVDERSGREVVLKKGRFGDYLEVVQTPEEVESKASPKRVTIPPGVNPSELTSDLIQDLLEYPKSLGNHPETGAEVVLALGRYGAYLSAGDKRANVGDWREALKLGLTEAVAALEQERPGWGGRSSKPAPLKEFGKLDGADGEVKVMSGRYGPYVTDGKINATLPKGTDPNAVTPERAVELLKAKAAAGPSKRPVRRKARR